MLGFQQNLVYKAKIKRYATAKFSSIGIKSNGKTTNDAQNLPDVCTLKTARLIVGFCPLGERSSVLAETLAIVNESCAARLVGSRRLFGVPAERLKVGGDRMVQWSFEASVVPPDW